MKIVAENVDLSDDDEDDEDNEDMPPLEPDSDEENCLSYSPTSGGKSGGKRTGASASIPASSFNLKFPGPKLGSTPQVSRPPNPRGAQCIVEEVDSDSDSEVSKPSGTGRPAGFGSSSTSSAPSAQSAHSGGAKSKPSSSKGFGFKFPPAKPVPDSSTSSRHKGSQPSAAEAAAKVVAAVANKPGAVNTGFHRPELPDKKLSGHHYVPEEDDDDDDEPPPLVVSDSSAADDDEVPPLIDSDEPSYDEDDSDNNSDDSDDSSDEPPSLTDSSGDDIWPSPAPAHRRGVPPAVTAAAQAANGPQLPQGRGAKAGQRQPPPQVSQPAPAPTLAPTPASASASASAAGMKAQSAAAAKQQKEKKKAEKQAAPKPEVVVKAEEFQQSVLNEREEARRKAGLLPNKNNAETEETHGRCCLRPGGMPGSSKCEFAASNFNIKDSQRRVHIRCTNGCSILYHQTCWRKFKDDFKTAHPEEPELLKSAKMMYKCVTESCTGFILNASMVLGHGTPTDVYTINKELEEVYRNEKAQEKEERAAARLAEAERRRPQQRRKRKAGQAVVGEGSHENQESYGEGGCGGGEEVAEGGYDEYHQAAHDTSYESAAALAEQPGTDADGLGDASSQAEEVIVPDEMMLMPLKRTSSGEEDQRPAMKGKKVSGPAVSKQEPSISSAAEAPAEEAVKGKKQKKRGTRVHLTDFLGPEAAAPATTEEAFAEAQPYPQQPLAPAPAPSQWAGLRADTRPTSSKPSPLDFPALDGSLPAMTGPGATEDEGQLELEDEDPTRAALNELAIVAGSTRHLLLDNLDMVSLQKQPSCSVAEYLKNMFSEYGEINNVRVFVDQHAVAISYVMEDAAYTARMFSHNKKVFNKHVQIRVLGKFPTDANMCRVCPEYEELLRQQEPPPPPPAPPPTRAFKLPPQAPPQPDASSLVHFPPQYQDGHATRVHFPPIDAYPQMYAPYPPPFPTHPMGMPPMMMPGAPAYMPGPGMPDGYPGYPLGSGAPRPVVPPPRPPPLPRSGFLVTEDGHVIPKIGSFEGSCQPKMMNPSAKEFTASSNSNSMNPTAKEFTGKMNPTAKEFVLPTMSTSSNPADDLAARSDQERAASGADKNEEDSSSRTEEATGVRQGMSTEDAKESFSMPSSAEAGPVVSGGQQAAGSSGAGASGATNSVDAPAAAGFLKIASAGTLATAATQSRDIAAGQTGDGSSGAVDEAAVKTPVTVVAAAAPASADIAGMQLQKQQPIAVQVNSAPASDRAPQSPMNSPTAAAVSPADEAVATRASTSPAASPSPSSFGAAAAAAAEKAPAAAAAAAAVAAVPAVVAPVLAAQVAPWDEFDAVHISATNDELLQGHYRKYPVFSLQYQHFKEHELIVTSERSALLLLNITNQASQPLEGVWKAVARDEVNGFIQWQAELEAKPLPQNRYTSLLSKYTSIPPTYPTKLTGEPARALLRLLFQFNGKGLTLSGPPVVPPVAAGTPRAIPSPAAAAAAQPPAGRPAPVTVPAAGTAAGGGRPAMVFNPALGRMVPATAAAQQQQQQQAQAQALQPVYQQPMRLGAPGVQSPTSPPPMGSRPLAGPPPQGASPSVQRPSGPSPPPQLPPSLTVALAARLHAAGPRAAPPAAGPSAAAPPAAAPRPAAPKALMCTVCRAERAAYINRACKHSGPCLSCLPDISEAPQAYPKCAMCASPTETLMKIYIPK